MATTSPVRHDIRGLRARPAGVDSVDARTLARELAGAVSGEVRFGRGSKDADGHVRMAGAEGRDELEAVSDPHSRGERALRRRLDHRSVGDGIGKGDAQLDHVRSALDDRVEQARTGLEVGIAKHEEGAERAVPVEAMEHRSVAAHVSSARA